MLAAATIGERLQRVSQKSNASNNVLHVLPLNTGLEVKVLFQMS